MLRVILVIQLFSMTVLSMDLPNSKIKNYKVQKGETLADISEVLFGDRSYWPKIWSMNKGISNPYNIPEGTVLHFNQGSASESPSLTFDAPTSNPYAAAQPEVLSLTPNIEIPKPKNGSFSQLNEIPASLPEWKYQTAELPKTDIKVFELNEIKQKNLNPPLNLGYYVTDNYTEGVGSVKGVELDFNTASEYQSVYVRFEEKPKEKKYLVVKNIGRVKDPFQGEKAILNQVQGVVEIQDVIDEDKEIYRALVIRALVPIEKGSQLIVGEVPLVSNTNEGSVGKADAQIIGGLYGLDTTLLTIGSIAFINKGKEGGLSEGVLLPVFKNPKVREEKSLVKLSPKRIGQLKVVKVGENISTALIIEANEEILKGDGTSPEAALEK